MQLTQQKHAQTVGGIRICIIATVFISPFATAHSGHQDSASLKVCKDKTVSTQCSYQNTHKDTYIGTCQLLAKTMMCVRNQPVQKADTSK